MGEVMGGRPLREGLYVHIWLSLHCAAETNIDYKAIIVHKNKTRRTIIH